MYLVVLSLRCCMQAFSSCVVAVRELLIVVASLVAEHGLQAHGLSSCDTRA